MAHEIDFSKGRPAIAYTGRKPWHGYGEVMEEEQPLDVWRVAAGLDWEVERTPVKYDVEFPDPIGVVTRELDTRDVLLRSDNKMPLSVVSNRFKVVQPKEIIEFFKSVIEHNGFKMSTAGALRDGRRVWAMADTGKDFNIAGDRVGGHLLLATAYDGTFSTTAQFTSIRVVCNNTLSFSLNRGGEGGIIKIPHTQDFNEYDVKAGLGLDNSWVTFRDNVISIMEHKVTKREAIDFFLAVCGVTEDEAVDGKQLSNVKKLLSYYESGPGAKMMTAKDTLWGCVNAVTFLADHGRRSANTGTRFDSASFGSGATMKTKAFRDAVTIAKAA